MKYIFVTLDAIYNIVSNRYLQSSEFGNAQIIANILIGKENAYNKDGLIYFKAKDGGVFYTNGINRNKGILFDYSSFDAFSESNNTIANIVTIFQKVLRYAVRYFESAPLSPSEKAIPEKNTIIVYPFPYVPARDVYKIFVDKNSTKWSRKDKDFLIAYASGTVINDEKVGISQTNINKAVTDIASITIIPNTENYIPENVDKPLGIVELVENTPLSLDSSLRFEDWKPYLTTSQTKFVYSDVNGPERLEGAAGTGKTLSMILRAVYLLKQHIEQDLDYHIAFITHSLATKNHIIDIFKSLYPDGAKLITSNLNENKVSINITTLQEWSINYLGNDISSTEYIDKDAQDSKTFQQLIIEQVWKEAYASSFQSTYKTLCSKDFTHFIATTTEGALIEMLQYEIAILIKGRASGDIDVYKSLLRPKYSIPCRNEGDLAFIFSIYMKYQEHLERSGAYDSDDIILTALGSINTPIIRRRRMQEGYSVCFIDETHMFNLNELSLFHYLNKTEYARNIIYAIDKSQAVGDRDISNDNLQTALQLSINASSQRFETVFRSSPDIINLAFNILSSGATLFTTFENPLEKTSFNFTSQEEKKCRFPQYIGINGEQKMISEVFILADKLHKECECKKSQILITITDDLLLRNIEKYAQENNKPIEVLKSRGDFFSVQQANKRNLYVIGGIDYVGGLEFDAEIIVGVDKNRVPPASTKNMDSYHFINYAWHNRLYVAITRTKYALIILGDKTRGSSELLESALYLNLIEKVNWDN